MWDWMNNLYIYILVSEIEDIQLLVDDYTEDMDYDNIMSKVETA